MDLELAGKRAYLTATSSGLGKAVAIELVHEGADIVISSHNEHNLQAAVDSIVETTGQPDMIDYTVCD